MTETFYRSSLSPCSVKPSEQVKERRCDYQCWSQLSLTLLRLLITWTWSILLEYWRGNTTQKHVLHCSWFRMLQWELEQEAKGANTLFNLLVFKALNGAAPPLICLLSSPQTDPWDHQKKVQSLPQKPLHGALLQNEVNKNTVSLCCYRSTLGRCDVYRIVLL